MCFEFRTRRSWELEHLAKDLEACFGAPGLYDMESEMVVNEIPAESEEPHPDKVFFIHDHDEPPDEFQEWTRSLPENFHDDHDHAHEDYDDQPDELPELTRELQKLTRRSKSISSTQDNLYLLP